MVAGRVVVGRRVVVVGGRVVVVSARVVVVGRRVVVVWAGVVRVVPVPATVVLVLVAGTVLEVLVVVTGTAAVPPMKLLTHRRGTSNCARPRRPEPLHLVDGRAPCSGKEEQSRCTS